MARPLWHELTPRGVQWGHTIPHSGPRTFRGLGIVDAQGGVVTAAVNGAPWDTNRVTMIPLNTNPAPPPGSGMWGGGAALQSFIDATQNAINPTAAAATAAAKAAAEDPMQKYGGMLLLLAAAYFAFHRGGL